MTDQKNLILAIVLSAVIMITYELFFAKRPAPLPPEIAQQTVTPPASGSAGTAPAVGTASSPVPVPAPAPATATPAIPGATTAAGIAGVAPGRAQVIQASPRVTIDSPRLLGSINLKGGRVDDLLLKDYRTEIDPESQPVLILSPQGTAEAYFAEFGWVGNGISLPGPDTIWTANRTTLAVGQPVTLAWRSPEGLTFELIYDIDPNFLFTITQRVTNAGAGTVTLYPYGYISRRGTPPVTGYFVLHEGFLGVVNGTLKEETYAKLKDSGKIENDSVGGWVGITDKYWLTALVPDQKTAVKTRFVHTLDGGIDKYQVDFLDAAQALPVGATAETTNRLFAGAKEVARLDDYADRLGIARFDLAIDFGWFYFLTKPIFYALIYLHKLVGNFGLAILLLTVAIKLAFFPLANKSYKAMSKMRALQPQMLKLRERYANDKLKLNQETMALYKKEQVNPAAGCLPMVIQIPVFFALYKVLFVTIEMRHAPFYGWIKDLSMPDPTSIFNLFGLLPFTPPDFLMLGVWPLIMGVTMWLQMKLNPQPVDPIQAKVFAFMPIVFTFMLAAFPAGLVIYWAWNNCLSILQQWVIMKRMGVV